jgi:hypothetical protein
MNSQPVENNPVSPAAYDRPVYERHSSGMDHIMTKMPSWIIRWGTLVLLLLFSGLFVIAGFIRYPDVAAAPVSVTQIPHSQTYLAKGKIPIAMVGKIRTGQKAVISLAAYPPGEFGNLTGTVRGIYPSRDDSVADLYIDLDRGLRTSLDKTLSPVFMLNGTAQVYMSDRSLLGRLFDKIIP